MNLFSVVFALILLGVVHGRTLFSCNFEQSAKPFCGMVQNLRDTFDWSRAERTPSGSTGPDRAYDGSYFMFIETSDPRKLGDTAMIFTPTLFYAGAACVDFYYHMRGGDMGSLKVVTRTGVDTDKTVFEKIGQQGNNWIQKRQSVDLLTAGDRGGFVGVRGKGYRGDVAVDKIEVSTGYCDGSVPSTTAGPTGQPSGEFRCDFEASDICKMVQSNSDQIDWTRKTGATGTSNTGPSSAASGSYYMYIETSDPVKPGHKAVLASPVITFTGDVCVSFKYHMYGSGIGKLEVKVGSVSKWSKSGDQGNRWLEAKFTGQVSFSDPRVYFEATRGNSIRGDIAIDQVLIKRGPCSGVTSPPKTTKSPTGGPGTTPGPTAKPTPKPGTLFYTSFETGKLEFGLTQDSGDNMDWTIMEGKTPSYNTGPNAAYNGKYYLYLEATKKPVGSKAILRMPRINGASGTSCATWYYSMHGYHMGTLQLQEVDGGTVKTKWEQSGDQGNAWYKAAANIDPTKEHLIVGIRGTDYQSDVAIDYIQVKSGPCESPSSPNIWQCNFELNDGACYMCDMEQLQNDNFDWKLMKGKTPSDQTGPTSARNGQHYMYIEATGRRKDEKANLMVPWLRRSGDHCFTLHYHMYGWHMGSLVIYQLDTNNGRETVIKTESGRKGNSWRRLNIDANLQFNDRIGIRGIRGTGYSSDLAIDDLAVKPGRC